LSAVPAIKKQQKQVGKMPKNRKYLNLEVVMTKVLEKFRHNPQSFKSRYSRSRIWGLGLKVLTRSRLGIEV